MIAKAIGPQNTVGAIGIMPSTVDTAVSMIGRKRVLLASMAASQTSFAVRPFRLDLPDQNDGILGDHAEERQDAENCNETQRPARHQQRRHDADQPERSHAEDQQQALKALQFDHQDRQHDEQHDRHDRDDRGLRFLALLHGSADGDAVGTRQGLARPRSLGASAVTTVSGSAPGLMLACTVRVGTRSRRQTTGYSCSYPNVANWLSGTVRPFGQRHLHCAQGRKRHPLLVRRPRHDVDQIDVVAHLCDRGTGYYCVEYAASDCELTPSRRASSWSTRMRTWRAGSIQSKLTFLAWDSAAMTWASSRAISRT